MDERLNSCEMQLRLVGVLAGLPGSNSAQDRRLHCALHCTGWWWHRDLGSVICFHGAQPSQ